MRMHQIRSGVCSKFIRCLQLNISDAKHITRRFWNGWISLPSKFLLNNRLLLSLLDMIDHQSPFKSVYVFNAVNQNDINYIDNQIDFNLNFKIDTYLDTISNIIHIVGYNVKSRLGHYGDMMNNFQHGRCVL